MIDIDLLQYILGEEVQESLSHEALSVIEGQLFDNIQYDEEKEQYFYQKTGYMPTYLKENKEGVLYLEIYKEIIEKAIPLTGNQDLLNIIAEELQPYFLGDRSALDVTRKIDNRVQLYLDENY